MAVGERPKDIEGIDHSAEPRAVCNEFRRSWGSDLECFASDRTFTSQGSYPKTPCTGCFLGLLAPEGDV